MADVGENNPVVKEYLKDIEEYYSTRHDDYADMLNILDALNRVKESVKETIREHYPESYIPKT